MTNDVSLADIAAVTNDNNNSNCGWGGNWGEWILVFLIFAVFGWGGFGGFGAFGGGSGGGYGTQADIQRSFDTSTIISKLDGINNGLCDGFYAQNTNMLTGFGNTNTAIMTQGYETRNAVNNLNSQLASCCCDIREGISGVNYNAALNANAIQNQIATTGNETQRQIERGFCDTNYNMATQNCQTLQAINGVGDRIINYLVTEKTQALRDENQALRLSASQQAQNNYIIGQLRPSPVPSYNVPNPYCCNNVYSCNNMTC